MSELSEKPSSHIYLAREEIRGLFTLGLLAIVASIRIQNKEITITVSGTPYNVTVFLDVMLILWSFYAFFMVLGLSDDIIGENASKTFRRISKYYLYFSYFMLASLAMGFYYTVYHIRAIGLLVFGFAALLYWSAKKIYLWTKKVQKVRLSAKSLWKKSFKWLKSEWYQFLFSGFFVCLLLAVAGTHEEFVIVSSIIGSIFLILFLIARDRKKKTESE